MSRYDLSHRAAVVAEMIKALHTKLTVGAVRHTFKRRFTYSRVLQEWTWNMSSFFISTALTRST